MTDEDRSAPTDRLLDALAAIVGPDHLLVDADLRRSYETDWTGRFHGEARAVVRPASTAQVASVVRACAAAGAAICTQGGNTGLVGGGVPGGGEVLVSTRRLSEIGEVDVAARSITVGAGATIAAVQGAARAAGLDFAIDFGARDTATVGGAIATNAGGSRVVRYGTMRAQVRGVEVVLADGGVLDQLGSVPKSAMGTHLPTLFCGSEGTLGIITAAQLGLVPPTPVKAGAWIAVTSLDAALDVLGSLRGIDGLDSIEIAATPVIGLIAAQYGLRPLQATRAADTFVVMAECAAAHDPTDELTAALSTVAAGRDAAVLDGRGCAAMERIRDHCSLAIAARGTAHKLDVAVPLGALAALLETAQRAAARCPDVELYAFGHLAEGNLHLNFLGTDEVSRAAITDEVLAAVVEARGSVSAEHGIGRAKRVWAQRAHRQRGAASYDALVAVRAALDPQRLLNPGVLFADG